MVERFMPAKGGGLLSLKPEAESHTNIARRSERSVKGSNTLLSAFEAFTRPEACETMVNDVHARDTGLWQTQSVQALALNDTGPTRQHCRVVLLIQYQGPSIRLPELPQNHTQSESGSLFTRHHPRPRTSCPPSEPPCPCAVSHWQPDRWPLRLLRPRITRTSISPHFRQYCTAIKEQKERNSPRRPHPAQHPPPHHPQAQRLRPPRRPHRLLLPPHHHRLPPAARSCASWSWELSHVLLAIHLQFP